MFKKDEDTAVIRTMGGASLTKNYIETMAATDNSS